MLASTEYTNVRLWLRLKVAAGFVDFVAQRCLSHHEVTSAASTQAWPFPQGVILFAKKYNFALASSHMQQMHHQQESAELLRKFTHAVG